MTTPHLPQQPTSGSDRVGGKSARSRRVADALATYRARLNERQTLGRPSPAIDTCLLLLKQAEDALGRDDLSGAWSLVLEAERTEIVAMSDEERKARAVALRAEAGDKLRGWRRKAVSELLGDGVHGRAPNADELREAMQVRNEHFHNLYHKLDLTREQLIFLGVA